MNWPETLPVYPLLLIAVVIVSRLLPLPSAYHPLTLFRFFAQQLAKKVNPDLNRSKQQQRLSGSLAVLVALLPILLLFYALYQFSELPIILDALLLYCSLDWRSHNQNAVKVSLLLQQKQLALAHKTANHQLLRDTDKLNAMGLTKAIIESLLLHSSKLFIATLGCFLLGGGLAALGYRLLQELQRQWQPVLTRFTYFGQTAHLLASILAAPAVLLSSMLIALQYGVIRCYKQRQQMGILLSNATCYLLCNASIALNRDLGGPAYYEQKKISRQRFNANYPPEPLDIIRVLRLIRFLHFYLLLLLCAISLITYIF